MHKLSQLLAYCRTQRSHLTSRFAAVFALLMTSIMATPALAALPTAVAAGTGTASGDYISIAQQYFKQGFLFLGLLLAAYALYAVAGGAISKFNEFRIGRAELSDVVVYAVVGVVILVIIVYLLTEASTIL